MDMSFSVTSRLNIRNITVRLSSDDNIVCDFCQKGTCRSEPTMIISRVRGQPYPQRFRDERQVGHRHPL